MSPTSIFRTTDVRPPMTRREAGEFFCDHPRQLAVVAQANAAMLRLVGCAATLDTVERTANMQWLIQNSFQAITVFERCSPIGKMRNPLINETSLLVHRDVCAPDERLFAEMCALFDNKNFILPGFRHISEFEMFCHPNHYQNLTANGDVLASLDALMKCARPILKYGLTTPKFRNALAQIEKLACQRATLCETRW